MLIVLQNEMICIKYTCMGNDMKDTEKKEKLKKKKDPDRVGGFLFKFVEITMWASVIIITYLMIKAPSSLSADMPDYVHPKAYYTLMLSESILGCIVMQAAKKAQGWITIPSWMLIPFVIFLYCAIFLGEVRMFYYRVNNWDTFLHFFSAGMLGSLAFSIISLLNQSKKVPMQLSPAFVAIFAFCFAVTCGAIWEIYEYTFDGILGLNMQKFMLEDGTQLVGRAALADTMKDIITDVAGAGVVALAGYFAMKKNSIHWLNSIQLRLKHKPAKTEKSEEKKPEQSPVSERHQKVNNEA